jgi:multidrug transporter EmrE-like cation transporter
MLHIFSNVIQTIWSVLPNNFYVLVTLSALCEALSVYLFKVSGNRGWVSGVAYVLGFLVIAFYGEALRYSKLGQSYPIWLALVAILVTVASVVLLKEDIKYGLWFAGFVLVIGGLTLIQFALPSE